MVKPDLSEEQVTSKAQFKPKALEYFRKIQETGRPLVITDNGVPVLKIVPYTSNPEAILQELRGSVLSYEDPTEPVGLDDWAVLG